MNRTHCVTRPNTPTYTLRTLINPVPRKGVSRFVDYYPNTGLKFIIIMFYLVQPGTPSFVYFTGPRLFPL